jgi:hypothetical protein
MLLFYRNSFILLLLCAFPLSVYGMSTIKHGDVTITIRNGKPCFSFPLDKETKKREYFFDTLRVSLQKPSIETWAVYIPDTDWKWSANPDRPAKCIEYDSILPELIIDAPAHPLTYDTPYRVFMVVSTRPWVNHVRRYLSEFCLTRNDTGETVIVEATWEKQTEEYRCLKPGESSKHRGFWDRLFGRD